MPVFTPLEATVAVGEGVELFEIADRMARLALHPGAQPALQAAVGTFERAGGQSLPMRTVITRGASSVSAVKTAISSG
nr:hypothetical protein [Marinicella sp. W31]MDC2879454.1 hypothetical protein [Marinicella sp. W31]